MKWKTRAGKEIKISDIEDSHLVNIKWMIERNGFVHSEIAWSCLAYACSGNTPEMAADAASAEWDTMRYSSVTDAIFNEFDKRNLGE